MENENPGIHIEEEWMAKDGKYRSFMKVHSDIMAIKMIKSKEKHCGDPKIHMTTTQWMETCNFLNLLI